MPGRHPARRKTLKDTSISRSTPRAGCRDIHDRERDRLRARGAARARRTLRQPGRGRHLGPEGAGLKAEAEREAHGVGKDDWGGTGLLLLECGCGFALYRVGACCTLMMPRLVCWCGATPPKSGATSSALEPADDFSVHLTPVSLPQCERTAVGAPQPRAAALRGRGAPGGAGDARRCAVDRSQLPGRPSRRHRDGRGDGDAPFKIRSTTGPATDWAPGSRRPQWPKPMGYAEGDYRVRMPCACSDHGAAVERAYRLPPRDLDLPDGQRRGRGAAGARGWPGCGSPTRTALCRWL